MNFINQEIEDYALAHSQEESDVLKKLNRDTYSKVLRPRMLSGHMQGNVLAMFSNMIQPKTVLEIGTYTGYSAICLAQGLRPNGMVHTIDINEELVDMSQEAFENAGVAHQIKQYIGSALDVIPTIDAQFDIVFIDADKKNYGAYYDLVIDKVVKGGYIIGDNVLWSGKVVEEIDPSDVDTNAIDLFNKKVQNDPQVDNTLLPIRDGLMMARKL